MPVKSQRPNLRQASSTIYLWPQGSLVHGASPESPNMEQIPILMPPQSPTQSRSNVDLPLWSYQGHSTTETAVLATLQEPVAGYRMYSQSFLSPGPQQPQRQVLG